MNKKIISIALIVTLFSSQLSYSITSAERLEVLKKTTISGLKYGVLLGAFMRWWNKDDWYDSEKFDNTIVWGLIGASCSGLISGIVNYCSAPSHKVNNIKNILTLTKRVETIDTENDDISAFCKDYFPWNPFPLAYTFQYCNNRRWDLNRLKKDLLQSLNDFEFDQESDLFKESNKLIYALDKRIEILDRLVLKIREQKGFLEDLNSYNIDLQREASERAARAAQDAAFHQLLNGLNRYVIVVNRK